MKTLKINIAGIYDITQFVKFASEVKPGVNVRKGSQCIDGASIMGMMALDTTGGIIVEYPADAKDFEDYISNFIANKLF